MPLMRTVLPELKRRIIGDTFMRVKDRIMHELKLDKDVFLAQGTLRPDLIESASELASGHADVIKTHHNDSALGKVIEPLKDFHKDEVRELGLALGLPKSIGKVIEPLKDFHKDEVRELGLALGLPKSIVNRHPFPGPGLAIRIICAENTTVADLDLFFTTQHHLQLIINLAECDVDSEEYTAITQHLSKNDFETLCEKRCEITATLLPVQSVGVQGDRRSYAYVAALSTNERPIPWLLLENMARIIPRLIHSDRRSYAYVAALSTNERPIPWLLLENMARIIPRLIHSVNRVVYVFGSAVEYSVSDITPTYLNDYAISLAQWADRIANDMPVIMIPVHFDRDPMEGIASTLRSFVLRPFITNDFMTGIAALPGRDIPEKVFTCHLQATTNLH
ncbi:unnamed protein product [Gongylonema pulchrum]|uniref:GMPS ATP-PPase domain-containing protein n=1 Tax=Gongylonema pulchrum TaxID=637853 RepID=A0A183DP28_9BILA|nr:unnamed protein product [Gongylonema pulchrum]